MGPPLAAAVAVAAVAERQAGRALGRHQLHLGRVALGVADLDPAADDLEPDGAAVAARAERVDGQVRAAGQGEEVAQ